MGEAESLIMWFLVSKQIVIVQYGLAQEGFQFPTIKSVRKDISQGKNIVENKESSLWIALNNITPPHKILNIVTSQ